MEQWQMPFAVPLNQPEPEKSTLNSDAKARSFQLEENRCVVFFGEPQRKTGPKYSTSIKITSREVD